MSSPDGVPASHQDLSEGRQKPPASALHRRSDGADVLAWIVAIPSILLGLGLCPFLVRVVSAYKQIFIDLQMPLPALSIFLFRNGWWLLTILPIAAVLGMLTLQLTSRDGAVRVSSAVAALLIVVGILVLVWLGITYPLSEFMRQANAAGGMPRQQ
jgi:hypothetical protein